ncbi:putative thymidylate synthase [Trichinella pseudospiralis]
MLTDADVADVSVYEIEVRKNGFDRTECTELIAFSYENEGAERESNVISRLKRRHYQRFTVTLREMLSADLSFAWLKLQRNQLCSWIKNLDVKDV